MKNKILLLAVVVLGFVSCTDLIELNIDKKNPVAVPGSTLFTSGQKNLVDQMVSTNVNYNIFRLFAQQWTETTYLDEVNYDVTTRAISQQHWDEIYRRSLANLKEAARLINLEVVAAPEEAAKKNRLAIVEIMSVYGWSVLVETFGNVPYSQALDVNILNPVYDDGLTIYKDLISRLNAAISNLDPNEDSFEAGADNIYQGNSALWLKFANSLKLRMGLTIADIEGALAKTTVESAATNVISSNGENATMDYGSSSPNTNPLWNDLVASGRQDFVGTSVLIDTMLALDDPRLTYFFQPNVDDPNTPQEEFAGGEYGFASAFNLFSNVSAGPPETQGGFALLDPTFPGTIMSYAEVEFLLAEAVERGFNVGGTAEQHYNNGVTASILEWGGTAAEAAAYLAQPEVAYSTAAGPWQQKIGFQAWLALYNRGYEAWLSYRRLDYPILVAPSTADVPTVPVRLTYPIVEQTLNPDQYDAAAAAIGEDLLTTKLFFDIH